MFKLSEDGLAFVKKELGRYESKQSAIIPALYRAQSENGGWISEDVIEHLSQVMGIPSAQIEEVFKFYTMFNQKPVGRYHVQVCNNITCSMMGGREILSDLCSKHGVKKGEMTQDGKFTFSNVECLGSCDTAPMMQINDAYYENLNEEKIGQIINELK